MLAGAISPAGAGDIIIGEGTKSWGAWTKQRQARGARSQGMLNWVFGYVSGKNANGLAQRDFLTRTDADRIVAWIDNYCQSYPLATIEGAASKLVDSLQAQ